MCKIPFSRECGRGVCNVEGYAPTPTLPIYCSPVEGELGIVTHAFGGCFQESSSQLVFSPHPTLGPFMQCIKY